MLFQLQGCGMLEGIVYFENINLQQELSEILDKMPRIHTRLIMSLDQLLAHLGTNSTLFLVVALESREKLAPLSELARQFPHIYFVYYSDTLNIDHYQHNQFSPYSNIVVGEKRKENFQEIVRQLTHNYWKKIPFDSLGLSFDQMTPRLKRVMNYIETHDLKDCTISRLARYLKISQGYFSQEFKKETGMTFRRFMQLLLSHYEEIIFDRLDLSAKAASQLLGYSELSSFSRSFKKRKGYPPSQQKQQHLLIPEKN
jgi:AraC-like DNA-binding protein